MLKILRNKKTAKKVWIVLAIIIVPAFVLWGSGSLMRNKQEPDYAGRIFGRNVSILEYKDALDAVKNSAIIQYGDKFSEMQKSLNLEYRAWERLILLYEAKRRRINASDQEVRSLIASYPFFQRNGRFDDRIYSEVVQYVFRTQPRIFEEETRQDLIITKLYNRVTENVKATEKEITEEYRKLNEGISVYYLASLPTDFTKNLAPSEQELKDYFSRNSLEFKQPLSFNMDYIASDSEAKAKDLVLRLNRKEPFAKVAEEAGLPLKETGLFAQSEPIPGIGWSPEILSLISRLKIGQYTPPIHSDKYYYILKLKEIKEAYIPEFDKIKSKVKEAFIKDDSEKMAKGKIEECLKKLNELSQEGQKMADFSKIAKDYGLKAGSTELFKYGSYIEGIGASDMLWTTADELAGDNYSGIISMTSGFYVIKVKERVPVDQNKFTAEKEDFSKALLFQKKQEAFAKFTEELKRKTQ